MSLSHPNKCSFYKAVVMHSKSFSKERKMFYLHIPCRLSPVELPCTDDTVRTTPCCRSGGPSWTTRNETDTKRKQVLTLSQVLCWSSCHVMTWIWTIISDDRALHFCDDVKLTCTWTYSMIKEVLCSSIGVALQGAIYSVQLIRMNIMQINSITKHTRTMYCKPNTSCSVFCTLMFYHWQWDTTVPHSCMKPTVRQRTS